MRRTTKALLRLLPLVPLAAALAMQSCTAAPGDAGGDAAAAGATQPAGPSVNHEKHIEFGLDCATCHDPEGTGDQKLPSIDTCWGCHDAEALEDQPEALQEYLAEIRQPDGSYVFPKAPFSPGLRVNHAGHGAAGVACADCHGEPGATRFQRRESMSLKAFCMGCHEMGGAPLECATCHEVLRKDVKPASHTPEFRRVHGAQAPEGWKDGTAELNACGMCHKLPQGCNSCHQESMPQSHREAGFQRGHGAGYTDVVDGPFDESSCSLCHEEESCQRCHQAEMPLSHNASFRSRTHGYQVGIERDTCRVCHQQDFCQRCHESQPPASHVGIWGTGMQGHCTVCHDPLSSTNCFTCHKDTLGHLQATPLPPSFPHPDATPEACRVCHTTLPHFDDGGNCLNCHRR